jgi:two-component system, OmpR family, sensor histidine kinase KdpD
LCFTILVRILRWLGAMAGLALVTAAGVRLALNPSTIGFIFLIAVLLISIWDGLVAGLVASVAATLSFNYFFLPPLHTFSIAEPANWAALAAFLFASVIASRLVVAARVQAERAERRRTELETLYGLSVDLFTATNRHSALGIAAGRALQRLDATPEEIQAVSASRLPLLSGKHAGSSRQALESAVRLVALALERERFLEESAHVQALRESEALKTSLLRAISHDLTTPITAITIETEALRRCAGGDAGVRTSVEAIAEETLRLRRRVDNLLSMARLEAGKTRPRIEPTPPVDLIRAVRENLPRVALTVQVDPDCPDANIDPSLALEILVNLVENAHRASPPGAAVEIVAGRHPSDGTMVRIEILDRGSGLPPGVASDAADLPHRGLGLEIARSLAIANGGSISLGARPGGGTIARINFPAAALLTLQERV